MDVNGLICKSSTILTRLFFINPDKRSAVMTKISIFLSLFVLLSIIAGIMSACSPAITYDEQTVRAYADHETEVTLQGLSEANLEKYTLYGDAKFKAAVTQQKLDQLKPNMDEELGNFVSIQFKSIETQGKYIIVHYQANYTKSEVGVRMVFDHDHMVAGQWFE
jgi:hypothetical protein